MNQHEFQFACNIIDDVRRLVTAGKTQRWDIVKWAVTINMALAAASVAVKQQHVSAAFFFLAVGVVVIAFFFMWEITRRINDSLLVERYLRESDIDVIAITGKRSPDRYGLNYDKEELRVYALILFASVFPALLLWWLL
jgi:hypothetical protein